MIFFTNHAFPQADEFFWTIGSLFLLDVIIVTHVLANDLILIEFQNMFDFMNDFYEVIESDSMFDKIIVSKARTK